MTDLIKEEDLQGLDFQALGGLRFREVQKTPTALDIVQGMPKEKNVNVPTKSLRVNGVCVQDSMESYLTHQYNQSSQLKKALISPLHYSFSLSDDAKALKELEKTKNHFTLGTFIHECILEPTKFSRVVAEPNYSRTTKDGVLSLISFWEDLIKEKDPEGASTTLALAEVNALKKGLDLNKMDGLRFKLEELKNLSGVHSISELDYQTVKILENQYKNYGGGILKKLLTHAKREISFYTEEDGIGLKVRPDAIQFKENIGVDAIISIKSTRCESLKDFARQCATLHYDLSEAMYQDIVSKVTGRDFKTTIMIMMQTVAPFGMAVLVWSQDDIATGHAKYQDALHIIREHSDSSKSYEIFAEEGASGWIDFKLPAWNNSIEPTN